jgi:hypothetical protein
VQQPGEAAGGAGELGRPAGQMGKVAAASGQPRLQLTLEPKQQLPRRLVEGEQGRPVVAGGDGQAGRQGLEFEGVAVGHRWGDGGTVAFAVSGAARLLA